MSNHTVMAPKPVPVVTVPVSVTTNPPGARIAIDGKDRGTSVSGLPLPVGTHTVQAMLEGYESASQQMNLVAGAPVSPQALQIPLTPLPPSLRVTTDAENAEVKIDDQPMTGTAPEFTADQLAAGKHKLSLGSRQGTATFDFELAPATLPATGAPAQAKSLNAVVVSEFGSRSRLYY